METNNTSPGEATTTEQLAQLRAELHGAQRALEEASRERVRASRRADAAEREVAALRAIVDGRTVPPTDAEIDAHEAAGGQWRCSGIFDDGDVGTTRRWANAALFWRPGETRWWALDADGRPCAWPSVDGVSR